MWVRVCVVIFIYIHIYLFNLFLVKTAGSYLYYAIKQINETQSKSYVMQMQCKWMQCNALQCKISVRQCRAKSCKEKQRKAKWAPRLPRLPQGSHKVPTRSPPGCQGCPTGLQFPQGSPRFLKVGSPNRRFPEGSPKVRPQKVPPRSPVPRAQGSPRFPQSTMMVPLRFPQVPPNIPPRSPGSPNVPRPNGSLPEVLRRFPQASPRLPPRFPPHPFPFFALFILFVAAGAFFLFKPNL